jgi:uncharacterized protein YbjT (DUF2867 family)
LVNWYEPIHFADVEDIKIIMAIKILVIGATGTIGTKVCELLKAEKADFTALVRNDDKAKNLASKGINTVKGDLADLDSLIKAMQGIDKLFLLSVTSPDLPKLQGNAAGIAKEKGVKHIVKISVRGAAIDADFNIGRFHGKVEKEIRELGIPFTFLQPHSFLQNLFFERRTIVEQDTIYSSMGDGKIPMIDTRDIAAVAVKALQHNGYEGKSYILTGAEAISYHNIVNELSKVLGRKINYVSQTPEEGHKAMSSSGMPVWLVDDMTHLNKIYDANKAAEVSPAVEQILGRKPISLGRFISDYANRFK